MTLSIKLLLTITILLQSLASPITVKLGISLVSRDYPILFSAESISPHLPTNSLEKSREQASYRVSLEPHTYINLQEHNPDGASYNLELGSCLVWESSDAGNTWLCNWYQTGEIINIQKNNFYFILAEDLAVLLLSNSHFLFDALTSKSYTRIEELILQTNIILNSF